MGRTTSIGTRCSAIADARLQGGMHRVNPGARRACLASAGLRRSRGRSQQQKGRFRLATFITLARYTQQGVSKVKDSPTRVDNFRNAAQKAGGSLKSMYLTLGRYDLVLITEAPSDDVVARLTLATASLGNVTTETLRAFTEDEFRKIVSSLP